MNSDRIFATQSGPKQGTKTGNKRVSFSLISLPLYAVSELDSILNEYLASLTPTMGYREGL